VLSPRLIVTDPDVTRLGHYWSDGAVSTALKQVNGFKSLRVVQERRVGAERSLSVDSGRVEPLGKRKESFEVAVICRHAGFTGRRE
jgi:hypothetical protein